MLAGSLGENWDDKLGDVFFRLRSSILGPERTLPDIVNIDLTDEIVDELAMKGGDRSDFARLVGVVSDAGAASLLFDIVFPGHGDLAGDSALARASEKAGNVYLPAIMRTDEYRKIDGRRADQRDLAARWLWHPRVTEAGRPLNAVSSTLSFPELTAAARGIGSINVEPDDDGVYRRVPLLTAYRDGFVPALALSAACDRLGVDPAKIEVAFGDSLRLPGARLPNGTVKDIDIPIDEAGRMIIDYAGRWTELILSASSLATILKAKNDSAVGDKVQAELDGALAIVCDLTTSSADYGPSPLERVYPKSGIHANVLDGILSDRFLREQTRLCHSLYADDPRGHALARGEAFPPAPGLPPRPAFLGRDRRGAIPVLPPRRRHAGPRRADPRLRPLLGRDQRLQLLPGRQGGAARPLEDGTLLRAADHG